MFVWSSPQVEESKISARGGLQELTSFCDDSSVPSWTIFITIVAQLLTLKKKPSPIVCYSVKNKIQSKYNPSWGKSFPKATFCTTSFPDSLSSGCGRSCDHLWHKLFHRGRVRRSCKCCTPFNSSVTGQTKCICIVVKLGFRGRRRVSHMFRLARFLCKPSLSDFLWLDRNRGSLMNG